MVIICALYGIADIIIPDRIIGKTLLVIPSISKRARPFQKTYIGLCNSL